MTMKFKNLSGFSLFDLLVGLGILLIIAGGVMLIQEQFGFGFQEKDPAVDQEMEEEEITVELDVTETGKYPAKLGEMGYDFSLSVSRLELKEEAELVEVSIPEGATALRVAGIMDEAGLIEFEEFTRLQLLFGFSEDIRAGTYTFLASASTADILEEIIL